MDRAVFNITNNGHRINDYYSDGTGEVVFSSTSQRDDFLRRGITAAEYLDEVQRTALVHSTIDRLPEGGMSASVATAIEAVLDRLQAYSRDKVSQLDTTDEERHELMRGERDLSAALTGIVRAGSRC